MKKINSHFLFIAMLLVLSLFFFKNIVGSSVTMNNIHYINDLAFISYNTKESLKNMELPLWTPYFYSGHPLIAIPENYIFDLNFLFIFLFGNIYLAMNFALAVYFFLSGLGMYLLVCNTSASENKKAAFIAAIIYMFNGFMRSFIIGGHINILEGYALMPFIFMFAFKALKSKEWVFYSAIAGSLFALQVFSGSMIMFFYTALILLIYFGINLASKNFTSALLKSLLVGLVISIVFLGLAAIKLLPVLEFTKMSSRAVNVPFKEFLGYPVNLNSIFRVLAVDFGYTDVSAAIGIIGIGLLIYGLSGYKKRLVAFSLIIIIFSVLFASGTFVASFMYKVPGFDKLRHVERSLVLFVFGGSMLAAYGFDLISERLKKYHAYLRHENIFFASISILILIELLFLHSLPPSAKVVEPDDIKILEHIGNDNSKFRTMNLAMKDIIGAAGYNYYVQKGISEAKGGGGIWVNDYVNFLAITQQSLNPKLLGVLNVKYLISGSKLEGSGVSFVDVFNQCNDCALPEAFGPYLYKNDGFLPRYYIVQNSILVAGDEQQVKEAIYGLMFSSWEPKGSVLIQGKKINDYNADYLKKFNTLILTKGSVDGNSIEKLREYASEGGNILPDVLNGKSSISSDDITKIFNLSKTDYKEIGIGQYSNNKVVLELNGEKGWLAASERFAHFPGWQASINGKALELLKADNAITALYLNGEKGRLIFEYKPSSYRIGKLISVLSLVIVIGFMCCYIYFKNYRQKR